MKQSSDFQTGGILLMVATMICAALAVMVTLPLLQLKPALSAESHVAQTDNGTLAPPPHPTPRKSVPEVAVEDPRFTEFYPSLASAKDELQRLNSMTGSAQSDVPPPQKPSATFTRTAAASFPSFAATDSYDRAAAEVISSHRRSETAQDHTRYQPGFEVPSLVDDLQKRGRAIGTMPATPPPTLQPARVGGVDQVPPSQVPSGSVYAPVTVHPVTVHVDGEIFAQQMQAMSQRFETLLAEQQRQHQQSLAAATEEMRKRKQAVEERQRMRAARQQKEQQVLAAAAPVSAAAPAPIPAPAPAVSTIADEQLSRIEDGMHQLSRSFQSLQVETEARLRKMSVQADRAEVANQVIESYDRVLQKRMQQLEQQPGQVRITLRPEQNPKPAGIHGSAASPASALPPEPEIWKSHALPSSPPPKTHATQPDRSDSDQEEQTLLFQQSQIATTDAHTTVSATKVVETETQRSSNTSITIPFQVPVIDDAPVPSRPLNLKPNPVSRPAAETTMEPSTSRLYAVPPATDTNTRCTVALQPRPAKSTREPVYHFELANTAGKCATCRSPGGAQRVPPHAQTPCSHCPCNRVACQHRSATAGTTAMAATTKTVTPVSGTSGPVAGRVRSVRDKHVSQMSHHNTVQRGGPQPHRPAWRVRLPSFLADDDSDRSHEDTPGLFSRMGSGFRRLTGGE